MNCTFGDAMDVDGLWYSLPKDGQCSTNATLGRDCYWRVASLDRVVAVGCLRKHGCARGGPCDAGNLTRAIARCPNLDGDEGAELRVWPLTWAARR